MERSRSGGAVQFWWGGPVLVGRSKSGGVVQVWRGWASDAHQQEQDTGQTV